MLDALIVFAFIAYSVFVGFRARKKASRGLEDYFLAGRGLKGWQAGTSMAATQFAADTPLLVAGLIATGGFFLVWRLWIYGLAFLLLGFLFASHWQRAGVLTDAELTEIRYSGRGVLVLRVVKAIYYGTIMNCVVLAMVLTAAVGIAEIFLPWHEWLPAFLYDPVLSAVQATGLQIASKAPAYGVQFATANNVISILCIVAFIALYSMTGGLRGVVATDVAQFSLAIIGMCCYAFFVTREAGGIGSLVEGLQAQYGEARAARMISFSPRAQEAILPFLILLSMQWLFQRNSDGTGYLAQRSMACEDERQARIAGVVFAWLQIFLRSIPWLLIGVALVIVYPFDAGSAGGDDFAAQRELLFVHGINDHMPIGIRGILLTAMLAALASTLDTHMNWGASYWSNDIYDRLVCRAWMKRQPGNHELVVVARLSNLVILAIALVVMAFLGSIQQAWQISLLFGAGVGSVLVLRWLWERINLWAELAAMIVSLIVAPLILLARREGGWLADAGPLGTEAWGLVIMTVISTATVFAAALLGPRTSPEVLGAFYQKVKPAGLWGRAAAEAGEDPSVPRRELWHGLWATALTGGSLYLVLYGTARLIFVHPDVPRMVGGLALVMGIALVPLWWKWVRDLSRREAGSGSERDLKSEI